MKEIIHGILMWLTDLGYWGILIGLMIEVIPSEIVLSYGGYLVSKGEITLIGAVAFGTVGCTVQQIIIYWIGRYGGRPFLEKYGKYLLIHKKHIDLGERWFNRYGAGIIFTGRFIPVVRQAISIPAGIARMSLTRFTVLTVLASIPWATLFVWLGMTLGDNWEQIDEKAGPFIKPFMIGAVVLAVLYFAVKTFRRDKRRKAREYGTAGENDTAHQLKFIGAEYKVLHSRYVRAGGSTQEFDHIVVGPNGVFHIDSKHWSGDVKFTDTGIERSSGNGGSDPTAQLYRHEYIIRELLRKNGIKADVVGIVCFTHPGCRLIGQSPAFTALKLDRLLHFIKTYRPKHPLTPKEVASIHALLEQNSRSSR